MMLGYILVEDIFDEMSQNISCLLYTSDAADE